MTDTIPSRLFQQAKKAPSKAAYYVREGTGWTPTTWLEYAREVRRAGKALVALGVEPGQTVGILGFNRPEWIVADVAAMCVGAAPAGIYTTCSAEEVQYILGHAQSPVVFVENEHQWQKIQAERERLPELKYVVTMRGAPEIDDPQVLSWEAFLEKSDKSEEQTFDDRLGALQPDGLATLIYTSGTTGPPKGVMLSHANLAWTAATAVHMVSANGSDSSLSYLPLSHIAEQMFSIHAPITAGYAIYFAESIERVPENLKEVQPTIFFGVPRIWEKFHAGIQANIAQATGFKKLVVQFATSTGREVAQQVQAGQPISGLLALKYKLANKLVYSKLKPAVGLGNARVCVSGAAPIAKGILEFFASLDIYVLEVYGQSEDSGPTTFNQPSRVLLGSVGPRVPGVEVELAEDGEILVKGPNVFLGYYRDEEATQAALTDGWLHSGDLGSFDKNGFLHITGRKKDIIITAGGKNIAPKNLENDLKTHPLVHEAVVVGDRRKFLSVLVTLDPEAAGAWAERHARSTDALHEDGDVLAEVQKAIDELNTKVARVEQLKKFTILPRPLTIEHGELTPTLKVKRNKVAEHFSNEIENMYAE